MELITGGAGFIGTNLADCLLSRGRRVCIYDSLVRAGTERNLRWLHARHGARLQVIKADIRNLELLRRCRYGVSFRGAGRRDDEP